MACIAVLDHNQKESDRPRRFVKRSAGQSLVNRALAYWIVRNAVLKMCEPLPDVPVPEGRQRPLRVQTYIPQYLPPNELPGLIVEDLSLTEEQKTMLIRARAWVMACSFPRVPILNSLKGESELPEQRVGGSPALENPVVSR